MSLKQREEPASARRCQTLQAGSEEGASAAGAVAAAAPRRRRGLPRSSSSSTASVVIAAITSCTNTSNPSVMIARRPAGEEGGRARPDAAAVGEDEPRARLEGRHRVSRARPASTPYLDRARLQPRRLRLHDLHRQQRAAARRRVGRSRREEPGRRLGAERQPQLRGPHPAAGARELPGVAAAGRRLRARRHDDDRSDDRAARHGPGRRAGLPARHLADASARSRRRC